MKLFWNRHQESLATDLDITWSLEFYQVELPEMANGPKSWDLRLGLTEFLLLEGQNPVEADMVMRCAATLLPPAAGKVFHWGLDLRSLAREDLFRWRRRIGFVAVNPVLLDRLTVRQNLTLAWRYHAGWSGEESPLDPEPLMEELHLTDYLDCHPRTLPPEVHLLAVWGREFLKNPRLILWAVNLQELSNATLGTLLPVLARYHREQHVAVCIAGSDLAFAYPWGQRLVRLSGDSMSTHALPGLETRPLTASLTIF